MMCRHCGRKEIIFVNRWGKESEVWPQESTGVHAYPCCEKHPGWLKNGRDVDLLLPATGRCLEKKPCGCRVYKNGIDCKEYPGPRCVLTETNEIQHYTDIPGKFCKCGFCMCSTCEDCRLFGTHRSHSLCSASQVYSWSKPLKNGFTPTTTCVKCESKTAS